MAPPVLEGKSVTKSYGSVLALHDVTLEINSSEVTCLLGDNGAGKSTLIKILSGVIAPDSGSIKVDGRPVRFRTAADAQAQGIATVFQDLAVFPLMPVYRNFFLRHEPTLGRGPLRRFDVKLARRTAAEQLEEMGVSISDVNRPIATLSGGERQCVAIARAVHFGARILILDEPTSALGVKEADFVLAFLRKARDRGVGILLITHNVRHAHPIGDRFVLLSHGSAAATYTRGEVSEQQLGAMMAGETTRKGKGTA